ncbi:hypothetical protein U27_04477 [Candidatus Vecturithrix granuli]|uniref:Uncharacterized protein n=1 Tax=Vecturithrix granuli TaxID=1499967 RepID=A0A081BYV5_VECG1|nr:hypothetical protein U27_04477 [Candidatus Vecturithrix granuli]
MRKTGLIGIKEGVSFPLCSAKPIRKIGNNSVVLRAVTKVKDYLDRTYYLALVPDRRAVVSDFFMNEFKSSNLSEVPEWNVSNFGYLTWSDIMKFCTEHNLESTLRVFKFNEGQIYTE